MAERCPICGGAPEVVSQGAYGYIAHCSECYEGDPEAERWRRLQGHADTAEKAIEAWRHNALDEASCDLHPHRPAIALNYLFRDLSVQVLEEAERQEGWVERCLLGVNLDIVSVEWGPAC
jgi:hypothetical protein